MLETKEQKEIFAGIIALIVILIAVSTLGKSNYRYKDNPQPSQQAADYSAYLASLKIDPKASKLLYQNIISEDQVREDIEAQLNVKQPIVYPVLDNSKIKVINKTGADPALAYFKENGILTQAFEVAAKNSQSLLFKSGSDLSELEKSIAINQGLLDQYAQLPVPKDVVNFHKAQQISLLSFVDLLKTSKAYREDSAVNPWPQVYKDYTVINNQVAVMGKEYDSLNKKYAFEEKLRGEASGYASGNTIVHSASASLPVIDIKAVVTEMLKQALSTAFAQFASNYLNKLIVAIESNYKIANFLYYTDALVSGQYVDDYLDKYVKNGLDKAMIKNFIPEMSCGNTQDLSPIFKAKADEYLGFDPATVSPSDPEYTSKMARVGNFLASPSGWSLYYQDAADQARAEAKQAAQDELTSEGFKASRDIANNGNISTAVASSLSSIKSAVQSYLDLGNMQSDSMAGRIASTAVQVFLGSYVFKGAVLKEQNVCISTPQIKPVIPNSYVPLEPVPPVPTESEVEKFYQPRGSQP